MDPFVCQEIIKTLAKETGLHCDFILDRVASYYEVETEELKSCLRSIDSPFVHDTNRIVGYIDGEPIKRTTYHMACKKIFERLHKKFSNTLAIFDCEDWDNNSRIAFISEAMYAYLSHGGPHV